MAAATVSLRTQKRRQAAKITAFLVGLAVATTGAFYFVHREWIDYRAGLNAIARGDQARGADLLARAIAAGVKLPRARVELGRTYLALGRPREALGVYETLAREAPGNSAFRDTVTGLYQTLGEPQRGIALYREQMRAGKLDAADLARLGDLHQQAGQFEDAVQCYREASSRLANPEVFARLGVVLSWLGRPAEAEVALTRAVQLAPRHRLAQIYLARAAVQDGRFAEAVDHYRVALPP